VGSLPPGHLWNIYKFFGIIAIGAVISLGLPGCGDKDSGDSSSPPNNPSNGANYYTVANHSSQTLHIFAAVDSSPNSFNLAPTESKNVSSPKSFSDFYDSVACLETGVTKSSTGGSIAHYYDSN
jgi:hypothetical protein